MTKVVYEIVQHDGGWAYMSGGVLSETFATHADALEAARIVAQEQQVSGATEAISFQDRDGRWRRELSEGGDRPETEVVDSPSEDRKG
jgi:hypothetical protein